MKIWKEKRENQNNRMDCIEAKRVYKTVTNLKAIMQLQLRALSLFQISSDIFFLILLFWPGQFIIVYSIICLLQRNLILFCSYFYYWSK